ncbi:MAG: alpha/beta hydrolase [Elusimicrobiota bacterium]
MLYKIKNIILFSVLNIFIVFINNASSETVKQNGGISTTRIEFKLIHRSTPTVVFETGLGATMESFNKTVNEIGKTNTVFAYNRPGYGKSAKHSTSRTGATIVDELRAFLQNKELYPPYILAGHSVGGLYMQLFARKYPDEIAGLILIDPTHPTQFENVGAIENQPKLVQLLFNLWLSPAAKAEFAELKNTGTEVLSLPTPNNIPIIILSVEDKGNTELARFTNNKRKDFSRLYPTSKQIWLSGRHDIPRQNPGAITYAIRDILEKLRRKYDKILNND